VYRELSLNGYKLSENIHVIFYFKCATLQLADFAII